ncbi:hypothetical protein [Photobacterium gaetbulicola]|uniref:hypothetical protein n=1 Tax=Photobacterium gaetbulicola TaxID=1295392 RepID=UPI001E329077|nr:hypothetical protein [Photobacterium gaetbulicola]
MPRLVIRGESFWGRRALQRGEMLQLSKLAFVPGTILRFCYQFSSRLIVTPLRIAIIYLNLFQGRMRLMMAITIRDTEKHQNMIDALKELTGKATQSGALIEGGYAALEFSQLHDEQLRENRRLQQEIYHLKSKVLNYVNALDGLREVTE